MSTIQENLAQVHSRIARAAARAGRDPSSVQLLGASKTVEAVRLREAMAVGLKLFGENRVQEAAAKIEEVGGGVRWHFIGHLQKNKARAAVELFDMIQSVDSLTVAQEIARSAERAAKTMPVLLEINVGGEKTKHGFAPDALLAQIKTLASLPRLDIRGLMAIPPYVENPETARPYFRALRELKTEVERAGEVPLRELSMGMSHDLEIAVEEGATLVRVGSALFGERRSPRRVAEEVNFP